MQKSNLVKDQIIEATIIEITDRGKAVCKINNFVIFLDKGIPQDIVKAKIIKVKKNYAEGKVIDLITSSPHRVNPLCEYFEDCGGCQLQNIEYSKQLEYKEIMVRDTLWHIGKISFPIKKIIPSLKNVGYRNQVQIKIQVYKDIKIGFYKSQTHDVVEISNCILQTELGNSILQEIRNFYNNIKYVSDDLLNFNIIIRTTDYENKSLIVFQGEKIPLIKELTNYLVSRFYEIHGILKFNSFNSLHVLFGRDDFKYNLREIIFYVSGRDFWQVNFLQIDNLIDVVLKYAKLSGKENILDIYCGSGLFSLFLAKNSQFVYGIELNPIAIINAKKNAQTNKIFNVKFIKGDVFSVLLKHNFLNIDLVVLDPPRDGCDVNVLTQVIKIKPKKIIYISCYPPTLVRDLQIFINNGYNLVEIQPIDMFPHTYHIECVVSLELA